MYRFAILTVILILAHVGHAQNSQPTKVTAAEDANRALAAAFESAWNKHDAPAFFDKFVTEDVDWVNVDGGRGKGRETVGKGHARVFAGKFKDSVMTIKNVEVSLVRPDVAVVHVYWGLRGDRNDDGTERQPREGLFTWLTVNDNGVWKLRASHNTNKQAVR